MWRRPASCDRGRPACSNRSTPNSATGSSGPHESTGADLPRRRCRAFPGTRRGPGAGAPFARRRGGVQVQVGGRVRLDCNDLYNPSCAYDEEWLCPLAPPENRLDVPIRTGELKYH